LTRQQHYTANTNKPLPCRVRELVFGQDAKSNATLSVILKDLFGYINTTSDTTFWIDGIPLWNTSVSFTLQV